MSIMKVEISDVKFGRLPHRYSQALARTRRLSMKADARVAKRADRRETKRLVRTLANLISMPDVGEGEWLST